MDLDFKEMYIFTLFKDRAVCKTTGLTVMLRYFGLMFDGINISAIYREIINYQIRKYGGQLETTRDNYIEYKIPSNVKLR